MDREHTSYSRNSQKSNCNFNSKVTKEALSSNPSGAPVSSVVTIPNPIPHYTSISGDLKATPEAIEGINRSRACVVSSGILTSTEAFSESASSICLPHTSTNRSASLPAAAVLDEHRTVPNNRHLFRYPHPVFSADLREAAEFGPLLDAAAALPLVKPMDELLPFAEQRRLYGVFQRPEK